MTIITPVQPCSSPFRNLGFGACGTVNSNRQGIPACIKAKDKMKKGEVKVESTDGVLALKWMDKRPVCMLSTIHRNEMVTEEKDKTGRGRS